MAGETTTTTAAAEPTTNVQITTTPPAAATASPVLPAKRPYSEYLSDVDRRLKELTGHVLPAAPYILRLPTEHPYHVRSRFVNNWAVGTKSTHFFSPAEEELQYLTFLSHQTHFDTLLVATGGWSDGKGSIATRDDHGAGGKDSSAGKEPPMATSVPSDGASQQRSPFAPVLSNGQKKKISLSDYRKRASAASRTPSSSTKLGVEDGPKPATANPSDATSSVEPQISILTTSNEREIKNDSHMKEGDSGNNEENRKSGKTQGKTGNADTTEESKEGASLPEQDHKIKSPPDASSERTGPPGLSFSRPPHSRSPARPQSAIPASDRLDEASKNPTSRQPPSPPTEFRPQANKKNQNDDKPFTLPHLLSPINVSNLLRDAVLHPGEDDSTSVEQKKFELPPLLSPTLPSEIEDELATSGDSGFTTARKHLSAGGKATNAKNGAPATIVHKKNTAPAFSNNRAITPESDARRSDTPESREQTIGPEKRTLGRRSVGDNHMDSFESRQAEIQTPRSISDGSRKSAIVKLSYGSANSPIVESYHKHRRASLESHKKPPPRDTSISAPTSGPSAKGLLATPTRKGVNQPENDSKALSPYKCPQIIPTVPSKRSPKPLPHKPLVQPATSVTKKSHPVQQGKSSHVANSEGDTKKEIAEWHFEYKKYSGVARETRRRSQKLLEKHATSEHNDRGHKGPIEEKGKEEKEKDKLGTVLGIESLIASTLAFLIDEKSILIADQELPDPSETWKTIILQWKQLRPIVISYPHLHGIAAILSATAYDSIHELDLEQLVTIDPTDLARLQRQLVLSYHEARRLWGEASRLLLLSENTIAKQYPRTWAKRARKPIPGSSSASSTGGSATSDLQGLQMLKLGRYAGEYFIPLAGCAMSPLEAARFAYSLLSEWAEQNGVKWERSLQL